MLERMPLPTPITAWHVSKRSWDLRILWPDVKGGEKTDRTQEHLDRTERAISQFNDLKNEALHPVDHQAKPYSQVDGQIAEINQNIMDLADEARLLRRKIDNYSFVSDEASIQSVARDIDTYLESGAPDETRELLELFVRSIDVGREHVLIIHTDHVPSPPQSEGPQSDLIARGRAELCPTPDATAGWYQTAISLALQIPIVLFLPTSTVQ